MRDLHKVAEEFEGCIRNTNAPVPVFHSASCNTRLERLGVRSCEASAALLRREVAAALRKESKIAWAYRDALVSGGCSSDAVRAAETLAKGLDAALRARALLLDSGTPKA